MNLLPALKAGKENDYFTKNVSNLNCPSGPIISYLHLCIFFWFLYPVRCMMYGFGDDQCPYTESVDFLEDLVVEYITEMVRDSSVSCINAL